MTKEYICECGHSEVVHTGYGSDCCTELSCHCMNSLYEVASYGRIRELEEGINKAIEISMEMTSFRIDRMVDVLRKLLA